MTHPGIDLRFGIVYPSPAGVGDAIAEYTQRLAAELRERGHAEALPLSPPQAARRHGDMDGVVLQYNPFSYARWGFAPRLLAQWAAMPRPRVLMIHEPYVPMRDARSAAMGAWQRAQLLALEAQADQVLISIEAWRHRLRVRGSTAVHLPVPSVLPDRTSARDATRREFVVDEGALVVTTLGTGHPSQLRAFVGAAVDAIAEAVSRPVTFLNLGRNAPPIDSGHVVEIRPGALPPGDLAAYIAASDLFLAPLVDGVSTRRTSVMTALQHGVATVSTHGELTDAIFADGAEAVALAAADDREGFVTTAVSVAADDARRERVARNGLTLYRREFDWQPITERLGEVLRRCAS